MSKSSIIWKLPRIIVNGLSRIHTVAKELNKETKIPYLSLFLDMCWSIFMHHATPNEYRMYRFYNKSHRARDMFLTGHRRRKLARQLNPEKHWAILDNKNEFNRHFSDFIGRQWLYAPDSSDEQIEEFLCKHKQIIVKPSNLYYGLGIYKLAHAEVTDMRAFCETTRKDCLMLEEIIEQHPALSCINPASVNTLRINTILDKAGVPHIFRANLRIGMGASITDNRYGGGIVTQVDLDSGILFTPAVGHDLRTHIKHPTTGTTLPGFQIPHWEAAKEMVLKTAAMVPQIRWVGWDVAITEKGPLLIEGNTKPGDPVMQLATQTGVYHHLRSYL